ncbi:hypothetical protein ACQUWM_16230 [Marinobacter sp. DUT-3]|uniref:hypothetical protein n=1 Tax=Marinobacter sp. DUT-3 TaxID=3412036 RepID=UPI003D186BD2
MLEKVIEKPPGQRIWAVRASSSGNFIPHFKRSRCVAIGHLDGESQSNTYPGEYFPNLGTVQNILNVKAQETGNPSWKFRAASHYGQVRNFIAQMKPGDLVVSMDRSKLLVGRIVGHPYISKEAVRIEDEEGTLLSKMDFELRRDVIWGPSFKRSSLPGVMQRSINSRQTVFCIDKYWSDIYHLIYPVFKSDDQVYFSTRIEKKEDISNFDIAKLFTFLSYIEAFSKELSSIASGNLNINDAVNMLASKNELTMSTVAEFMSPGSVWSKFRLPDIPGKKASTLMGLLLAYGAIFGIETPAFKMDGVIDLETRHKLLDLMIDKIGSEDFTSTRERLKLEVPNYNTTPLEDGSSDAQPSRHQAELLASLSSKN